MKKYQLFSLFLLSIPYWGSAQWQQTAGPAGSLAAHVSCLLTNNNNLFAGTGGGLFFSNNNGALWTALTDTGVSSLAISGNNIFAGTESGVLLSTNYGNTWASDTNPGMPLNTSINALAVTGTDVFAGSGSGNFINYYNDGVYFSNNNGSNWTSVKAGLSNYFVQTLAISGNNLFAGVANGLFMSSNNGTSWTTVNTGPSITNVNTLTVNGNTILAGTLEGVFIFNNDGSNWTSAGLDTIAITAIAVSGNNWFAGTADYGVFVSTNNGISWVAINTGLTNLYVTSLAICDSNLFAGTNGNGVFVTPLKEVAGIKELQEANLQVSIYPNPGKGEVYVTSNITDKNLLRIFDMSGKLMMTELMENGKSTIDTDRLAQGIYTVCITNQKKTINTKLVIMK